MIRAVMTFLIVTLFWPLANAQSTCSALFSTVSNSGVANRLSRNSFEVGRGLDHYETFLSAHEVPTFTELVQTLKPGSVYLDAGTGKAQVLRDLISQQQTLKLESLKYVGVAYKKPEDTGLERALEQHSDKLEYIDGSFIEQMITNPQSRLSAYRGQVGLITEVFGPLAYTRDISLVLSTYADLLTPGAQALLFFGEANTYIQVMHADGTRRRVTFRELAGVLVPLMSGGRLRVKEARMQRSADDSPTFAATVLWLERVQREAKPVVNPLKEIEYSDDAPPVRVYDLNTHELGKNLDVELIRTADIQKEESDLHPVHVGRDFR